MFEWKFTKLLKNVGRDFELFINIVGYKTPFHFTKFKYKSLNKYEIKKIPSCKY